MESYDNKSDKKLQDYSIIPHEILPEERTLAFVSTAA
jgi:hypothetical protein